MAASPDFSLVELLVAQPQMIERLAPQHEDDGSGRCKTCSRGAQTGRYRHPRAIRLACDAAEQDES